MRRILTLLSVCLALIVAGCSDRAVSPEAVSSTPMPAKIPADVQTILDQHAYRGDIASALLYPIPTELTADCDIYAVTFLWGDVFGPSPSTPAITDWSGRLSLNVGGVVHVRDLIDFEPGQDSVLIPDNPTFAAWISFTHMDFDGLSFLVFIKRHLPTPVVPQLAFETGPFTLTLTAYEMVNYAAFFQIDHYRAVAVHSRLIWTNHCPGGLIDGAWIKNPDDPLKGRMEGLWLDAAGAPVGIMTCEYWMNDDGWGEFHGYVSGYLLDVVIAEVKGRWRYDDPRMCALCGHDHGVFFGHYVYLNENRGGSIKGVFGDFDVPQVNAAKLPLVGVWYDDCPMGIHDPTPTGE